MSTSYQGLHSMLLNDVDLSDIRADQNAAMPDTCTVLRGTVSHSSTGAGTVSWGTVYTNVPCRLYLRWWERAREEVFYGGREASYQRPAVRVPFDFTVKESDRIVVRGNTYEVEFVQVDASWRTVNTAYLTILSS